MAGYTRNDTLNNIADGNIINAADLDGEYDAIEAAFNETTGHTHDGTSAEGAPITKLGPTQDLVVGSANITPKLDNTLDLGSNVLEFKDLWIDGTANIDALVADTADINAGTINNTTIGGTTPAAATVTTLTVNGNATLGDAATDTVTFNADVASNVIPSADDTYDLGAVGSEWKDLYVDGTANIDSLVADTADINAGTIDGVTIGGAAPGVGTFTTANATTVDTTNIEVTNIKAKDGSASATIADSTGVMTIGSAVLTTADINGGTADNVVIGGATAAAGTFTTATATTGNITTVNATTVNTTNLDLTNLEVTNIKAKDGTASATIADSTGVMTINSAVLTTADINGGTIDGVTIGTNSAATEVQIDNININGNTISVTNTDGDITITPNGTGGLTVSGTNSVTVPNGTTAQRDGTPASGMLRFNVDSDEFEGYNGTAWASVGGSAISNDTSTASDLYPIYVDATTGTAANVYTSNAQYLFKPSTGELKVKAPVAANGIVVNADTMTSNYTIDSGTNGLSVGPLTIDSGVTLTIAAGQRHLIL